MPHHPCATVPKWDACTKQFNDTIRDVTWKYKCVDDTLLYDSSIKGAFWHVYDFLANIAAKGITLKPKKFQFARMKVDFVGFRFGWNTNKPVEEHLADITDLPMPDKPFISNIQAWYGFINQLMPFLTTASIMNDFWELLKKPMGRQVYCG